MLIITTEPGEKPSFWFWYLGLMCTPLTFSGVAVAEMWTSSPVGVLAGLVKALFGHGSRQSWFAGVVTNESHRVTPGVGIGLEADAVSEASHKNGVMVATTTKVVNSRLRPMNAPLI
jgi:hypothetical protein